MQANGGLDADAGRPARVTGWRFLVWFGIALAGAALAINAIVFREIGGLFWLIAIPLVIAAVLAWRAMAGGRMVKLALIAVSALLAVVCTLAAILVVGLSIGQSPVVELVIWITPAIGAFAILLGSVLSLREA